MAIIYEGASSEYEFTLETINLAFTCIFILECIVKITGLGPKAYFHNNWNQFDFVVVLASLVDIVLSLFGSSGIPLLRVGP
jgi:hypothetical protein